MITIDSLVRLGGNMSVHVALVECKSVHSDEFMESTLGVKSLSVMPIVVHRAMEAS